MFVVKQFPQLLLICELNTLLHESLIEREVLKFQQEIALLLWASLPPDVLPVLEECSECVVIHILNIVVSGCAVRVEIGGKVNCLSDVEVGCLCSFLNLLEDLSVFVDQVSQLVVQLLHSILILLGPHSSHQVFEAFIHH